MIKVQKTNINLGIMMDSAEWQPGDMTRYLITSVSATPLYKIAMGWHATDDIRIITFGPPTRQARFIVHVDRDSVLDMYDLKRDHMLVGDGVGWNKYSWQAALKVVARITGMVANEKDLKGFEPEWHDFEAEMEQIAI